MSRAIGSRPIATEKNVAEVLLAAAGLAISEAELSRAVGESGRIQLAVEVKLNQGHVVSTEAGVAFRRRVYA